MFEWLKIPDAVAKASELKRVAIQRVGRRPGKG
jgi:hypothetical protein